MTEEISTKIALFKGKKIRKTIYPVRYEIIKRGDIAGGARKELEKKLGKSIVNEKNYLTNQQKQIK